MAESSPEKRVAPLPEGYVPGKPVFKLDPEAGAALQKNGVTGGHEAQGDPTPGAQHGQRPLTPDGLSK